jgi:hypothetical protein
MTLFNYRGYSASHHIAGLVLFCIWKIVGSNPALRLVTLSIFLYLLRQILARHSCERYHMSGFCAERTASY